MEAILKSINRVLGVTGSFVCDEEGEVLASAFPAVFDTAMLSAAARAIAQTVTAVQRVRRNKVIEMDLLYTRGRLIVKNVRRGCLCILCVPQINVLLLNMTADVAVRKLPQMFEQRATEMPAKVEPPASESLDTLSQFIELLVEEMGDRGVGRDDLLKILERRLERMKAEHPILGSVTIGDGRVDIGALQPSSPGQMAEATVLVVRSICQTCAGMLGSDTSRAKYRQVYDEFYPQMEGLVRSLGLSAVLENADSLEQARLSGPDFKL